MNAEQTAAQVGDGRVPPTDAVEIVDADPGAILTGAQREVTVPVHHFIQED